MLNYFIYGVVFFILAFVVVIAFKTINKGLELDKEKKPTYIKKKL